MLAEQTPTHELLFGGLFLIAFLALSLYIADQAKKGKVPYIRRLPAFDGIELTIDRCAELGKPVYYDISGLPRGDIGPMVVAALSILSYVARRCFKSKCRLIVAYQSPETSVMAREVLNSAIQEEGDPNSFQDRDLRFTDTNTFLHAAKGMEMVETEDCRGNIAMGQVFLNVLPLSEANKANGCVAIQGSAYMTQIHALGLATDYNFIGEELYAAAAMISRDADTLATLRSQDFAKLFIVALIPCMAIALALGVSL